jgi:hypothetical protein
MTLLNKHSQLASPFTLGQSSVILACGSHDHCTFLQMPLVEAAVYIAPQHTVDAFTMVFLYALLHHSLPDPSSPHDEQVGPVCSGRSCHVI